MDVHFQLVAGASLDGDVLEKVGGALQEGCVVAREGVVADQGNAFVLSAGI